VPSTPEHVGWRPRAQHTTRHNDRAVTRRSDDRPGRLFSHQSSVEVTRIPFLGELPYIGPRLFNAKRANQDETELLILVTPKSCGDGTR